MGDRWRGRQVTDEIWWRDEREDNRTELGENMETVPGRKKRKMDPHPNGPPAGQRSQGGEGAVGDGRRFGNGEWEGEGAEGWAAVGGGGLRARRVSRIQDTIKVSKRLPRTITSETKPRKRRMQPN